MTRQQTEAKKDGPQFALGDPVTLDGADGEICTVSGHKELRPDGSREYLYGVTLAPWARVEKEYVAADGDMLTKVFFEHPETKDRRDHERDTLGCIPESALKARKV